MASAEWPFYCDLHACTDGEGIYTAPCLPDPDVLLPESEGAAPDAQIAFFDGVAGDGLDITVPDDLAEVTRKIITLYM